jgi:hypothetical protein
MHSAFNCTTLDYLSHSVVSYGSGVDSAYEYILKQTIMFDDQSIQNTINFSHISLDSFDDTDTQHSQNELHSQNKSTYHQQSLFSTLPNMPIKLSEYDRLREVATFLATSTKSTELLSLYLNSIDDLNEIVFHDGPSSIVGEKMGPSYHMKMEALTCFVPGMIALGLISNKIPKHLRESHFSLATNISRTCAESTLAMPTRVGPDSFQYHNGEYLPYHGSNFLRPEVVESLFYMWRLTHDDIYREYGWKIFEALRTYCRLPHGGYSGLHDVRVLNPNYDINRMKHEGLINSDLDQKIESYTSQKPAIDQSTIINQTFKTESMMEGDEIVEYEISEIYVYEDDETGDDTPVNTHVEHKSKASDEDSRPPWGNWNDKMESFFLSETLKYLFLLFSPDELMPLDKWVFNTEGHPFPILKGKSRYSNNLSPDAPMPSSAHFFSNEFLTDSTHDEL